MPPVTALFTLFAVLSALELPYVPMENKPRKSFTSKALHPLNAIPKTRPLQKQRRELHSDAVAASASPPHAVIDMLALAVDGKVEDRRPSLLAKLFSNGSVPELGHSSSSEGEKEFASPEWDVPLSKNSVRKWPPPRPVPVRRWRRRLLISVLRLQRQTVCSRSPSRRLTQTRS